MWVDVDQEESDGEDDLEAGAWEVGPVADVGEPKALHDLVQVLHVLSEILTSMILFPHPLKSIIDIHRRSRETRIIKAYKLDPAKLGCFEKWDKNKT
jgi:hypothetical protein